MYCRKCGNRLRDDAVFCDKCGTKVFDDSENEKAKTQGERKQAYEGAIHKCPNCGHILDSYTLKCPECGYELRGEESGHPVQKLSEMLQKTADPAQKVELISTFYIPNTKEDIYDFFILSVSMTGDPSCDDAWISKLDQAYLKAKITFGNSKDFSELKALYVKAKKLHGRKQSMKTIKRNLKYITSICLLVAGIVSLIFGYMFIEEDDGYCGMIFAGFLLVFGSVSVFSIPSLTNLAANGDGSKSEERGKNNKH